MIKALHTLRKQIDDLYYSTFDNLTGDQRGSFQAALDLIDYQIKQMEQF